MNPKKLPPQGPQMSKQIIINFMMIIFCLIIFSRALRRSNSLPKNHSSTRQERHLPSKEQYNYAAHRLEGQVLHMCAKSMKPLEPKYTGKFTEVYRWNCNNEVVVVLPNKEQIQFIFTKGGTVALPFDDKFFKQLIDVWKADPTYMQLGNGIETPQEIQKALESQEPEKLFDQFPKGPVSPKVIEFTK